jgi:hypothetical protein
MTIYWTLGTWGIRSNGKLQLRSKGKKQSKESYTKGKCNEREALPECMQMQRGICAHEQL